MLKRKFLFVLSVCLLLIAGSIFGQSNRPSMVQRQLYSKKGLILNLRKKKTVSNKTVRLVKENGNSESATSSKSGRFTFKTPIKSNSKLTIASKESYLICTSKGYFYKPRNSSQYVINPLLKKSVKFSTLDVATKRLINDTFLLYAGLPSYHFSAMKRPPVRKIIFEEVEEEALPTKELISTIKITYTTGVSSLSLEQRQEITNSLKEAVKKYNNFSEVYVESYTDDTKKGGSITESLAKKRSANILSYLIKKGLPKDLINVAPPDLTLKTNHENRKKVAYIYLYSE